MNIAINGLGRIGRQVLKAAINNPQMSVVAVNDLADIENIAYLIKYDSVFGRYSGQIDYNLETKELVIDGKHIAYLSMAEPEQLPWRQMKVDVVVESTGHFASHLGGLKHINAGARKVVLTANAEDADISIVLGVNQNLYNPTQHNIVSNCSCTTNATAPVLKILNDNFSVRKAYVTTIHAVTVNQSLVDGPVAEDWRRGRSALSNTVPSTTGASDALSRVLPELEGRLTGSAYRVPVLCGSIVEVIATTAQETSAEEVNKVFSKAAESEELKGILEITNEKLVSSDIIGTTASSIIDASLTDVTNFADIKDENLVKVAAWYDNEFAYAQRVVDLTKLVGAN